MSDDVQAAPGAIPPQVTLLQMMTGYWVSQAVYVAAKLGIADHMSDGPRSCEHLATATNTHAPSLQRVLRALASVGVFSETSPAHFGLTPLSALLSTGTPDSMRPLAIMYNEEQYRTWADLLYSIRTGQQAFDRGFGMGVFEYFAENPEPSAIFNQAMTAWTHQVADAAVGSYDFSPFRTVVDVGGNQGTLLAAIIRSNPAARGILFDLPHVIDNAKEQLAHAGVADRCTLTGGDFFEAVPAGGDAYVLAQILHDWDDDHCVKILARCREVMPNEGRLLVIELVLPPGNEPFFGKWLDLHMLVMVGGRERNRGEYEALLRAGGFTVTGIVPTPSGASIVEAVPA